MQNKQAQYLETNPESLKKEEMILYELGLEVYEIRYLIQLKKRMQIAKKWGK